MINSEARYLQSNGEYDSSIVYSEASLAAFTKKFEQVFSSPRGCSLKFSASDPTDADFSIQVNSDEKLLSLPSTFVVTGIAAKRNRPLFVSHPTIPLADPSRPIG